MSTTPTSDVLNVVAASAIPRADITICCGWTAIPEASFVPLIRVPPRLADHEFDLAHASRRGGPREHGCGTRRARAPVGTHRGPSVQDGRPPVRRLRTRRAFASG